ncbi:MAG: response regulator transcription factor [Coriobacteriia bacterium]|nr:response regulator transcription factor [Coriobacteriia bacterium]MCL2536680.1 response regulator transcription factor [Coriobacteriia bacterium]
MNNSDYTILITDDDADIRNALEIYLSQEGFGVVQAQDGLEALQVLGDTDVHLVLLDVMMPQLDGIQTAVRIRDRSNVPIVFLSAKAEDTDRILGLNMGGDDYITKPFNPVELIARVKATLRRYARLGGLDAGADAGAADSKTGEGDQTSKPQAGIYQTGDLILDDVKKRVTLAEAEVKLTALEYQILKLLISHPEQVFSANQIYESVWNEPAFEVSKTVSVHVRRIREKIEVNPKEPQYLKMIYGLGYKVVKLT